jgi:hypothetical protein
MKIAFAFAAVLVAGTTGLAASASACSDKTARVEGMQLAQATVTTPTQTPAERRRQQQMNQMNAPTTGQGAAEPGKIGDEASPASNLPGRTPGSSASPSSQEANPSRSSSH